MGLIVKVAGTAGEVQNGPPLPGSQLRAEVAIGRRPACMQAGEDRSGPIIQCSDQAFTRSPLQNGEATETGTPSPDHANLRSRSLWQRSAAQQGTLVEPTWRNEAGTLLTNCPVKEVDPLSRLCSCIKGAKRGRPVTRLPTRLPSTVKALQPSQSQGGNRSG